MNKTANLTHWCTCAGCVLPTLHGILETYSQISNGTMQTITPFNGSNLFVPPLLEVFDSCILFLEKWPVCPIYFVHAGMIAGIIRDKRENDRRLNGSEWEKFLEMELHSLRP